MASVSNFELRCKSCSFSHLCIPVSLSNKEMDNLDTIIQRKRPLHKQDFLYSPGESLTSLFAVRSGSFKSFIQAGDGEQQITSFHLPGDVIGFDALESGHHQSFTQALETSMVCELPYDKLEHLSADLPSLRKQMLRLMSTEIKQDHQLMMLLNKRTAEERLSHFLLNLSERFAARGFSPRQFRLTMTRSEIGNHLGLTVETVSRLLSRFQKERLAQVDGKLITLLNVDALNNKLADHAESQQPCSDNYPVNL